MTPVAVGGVVPLTPVEVAPPPVVGVPDTVELPIGAGPDVLAGGG